MLKKQRGFTIIELIVVIAIIAVLATIVMANVSNYIHKARQASVKADIETWRKKIMVNYTETGSFSGSCDEPTLAKISADLLNLGNSALMSDCKDISNGEECSADQFVMEYRDDEGVYMCINQDGINEGSYSPSGGCICEEWSR